MSPSLRLAWEGKMLVVELIIAFLIGQLSKHTSARALHCEPSL